MRERVGYFLRLAVSAPQWNAQTFLKARLYIVIVSQMHPTNHDKLMHHPHRMTGTQRDLKCLSDAIKSKIYTEAKGCKKLIKWKSVVKIFWLAFDLRPRCHAGRDLVNIRAAPPLSKLISKQVCCHRCTALNNEHKCLCDQPEEERAAERCRRTCALTASLIRFWAILKTTLCLDTDRRGTNCSLSAAAKWFTLFVCYRSQNILRY